MHTAGAGCSALSAPSSKTAGTKVDTPLRPKTADQVRPLALLFPMTGVRASAVHPVLTDATPTGAPKANHAAPPNSRLRRPRVTFSQHPGASNHANILKKFFFRKNTTLV
jgi:hypothetical protein